MLPMPAGTSPAILVLERSRCMSSVSSWNPVNGSLDMLKLLPERSRCLSEVNLNNAGWTLSACRWWPPKSSEVTRPSAPSQWTPSQWQQSAPATHDRKTVE
ncbi:Os12g0212400 [Oryza sativa Japonica Group]|uniref:Os12g0212400 protein n=2 Tax=Oryza sativa subsp. japonica TaxID=39947 RepID=Q0IPE0_ORYSJ|nr:Os12g0212400 [Oryza sativa Japonica Group]BAT16336.1 Os12g0212400 [Oryza sativa Japonica Group]|eukprot:NP_001066406.1 Os12g0212400 [Oryza sativa Japonica Group]